MKRFVSSILIYCVFVLYSQAQPRLTLTNDIVINELGIRQILISIASAMASSNNMIIGDKELSADQPNFWILHNTSSNMSGVMFPSGHGFGFDLKTTNGIDIPKTAMGRQMSEPPKSLTDWRNGRVKSLSDGEYWSGDFPKLISLFNFPSNGIYVFELRCWTWSNSKKRFVLSDPVRVKVIKQSTKSSPMSLQPKVQTNSTTKDIGGTAKSVILFPLLAVHEKCNRAKAQQHQS